MEKTLRLKFKKKRQGMHVHSMHFLILNVHQKQLNRSICRPLFATKIDIN